MTTASVSSQFIGWLVIGRFYEAASDTASTHRVGVPFHGHRPAASQRRPTVPAVLSGSIKTPPLTKHRLDTSFGKAFHYNQLELKRDLLKVCQAGASLEGAS